FLDATLRRDRVVAHGIADGSVGGAFAWAAKIGVSDRSAEMSSRGTPKDLAGSKGPSPSAQIPSTSSGQALRSSRLPQDDAGTLRRLRLPHPLILDLHVPRRRDRLELPPAPGAHLNLHLRRNQRDQVVSVGLVAPPVRDRS